MSVMFWPGLILTLATAASSEITTRPRAPTTVVRPNVHECWPDASSYGMSAEARVDQVVLVGPRRLPNSSYVLSRQWRRSRVNVWETCAYDVSTKVKPRKAKKIKRSCANWGLELLVPRYVYCDMESRSRDSASWIC